MKSVSLVMKIYHLKQVFFFIIKDLDYIFFYIIDDVNDAYFLCGDNKM